MINKENVKDSLDKATVKLKKIFDDAEYHYDEGVEIRFHITHKEKKHLRTFMKVVYEKPLSEPNDIMVDSFARGIANDIVEFYINEI